MLKLKTINKDRRCKLTDDDVKMIKNLYRLNIYNMKELASACGVTHQRISQIIDRNKTIYDKRIADAILQACRYRADEKFRRVFLEKKRGYYKRKAKILKQYGGK